MQHPADARKRAHPVARNVTCPFCALLCDDLAIERSAGTLRVAAAGCDKAKSGFESGSAARPTPSPRIAGKRASLDSAVAEAAAILREARAPLIGGLATDVAGVRSALDLADRLGGFVDHLHGDALQRGLATIRDSGWITSTLTEIRNRADLIVLAGTDAAECPRFFERCVWNQRALFEPDPAAREIVFLGEGLDTRAGVGPAGRRPTHLSFPPWRLAEVVGALRALLAGRRLRAQTVAGIALAALEQLAGRLRAARYGVVVWAPARLDFPHAELAIEGLCDLVRELNEFTRFAGLPLGGDDGATTAGAVCAWQTGYPLRVDFGAGHPVFDPWEHAGTKLLAEGRADALVWISSFRPLPPPKVRVRKIVLGHPQLVPRPAPDVLIPVGTPGVHHAGQLARCDSVVTLPLRAVRPDPALPSTADVIDAVVRALG